MFFQNPHVHYFITVSNIDGSSETWDAQAYNLNIMSRRGWNANTLKVGDTVTVVGNLGRDERRLIAIQQVEKSDGTTLAIFDR